MTKRRSGFLPSRGKKDAAELSYNADDAAPMDAAFEDAAARMAFLNDVAKRASGFLPMRGRKSADSQQSLGNFEEAMEKRRVASFMPMRGRKWNSMMNGQAEMPVAVPAASAEGVPHYWFPASSYYHGALPAVQHPAPVFYYPVKSDSARYVLT